MRPCGAGRFEGMDDVRIRNSLRENFPVIDSGDDFLAGLMIKNYISLVGIQPKIVSPQKVGLTLPTTTRLSKIIIVLVISFDQGR